MIVHLTTAKGVDAQVNRRAAHLDSDSDEALSDAPSSYPPSTERHPESETPDQAARTSADASASNSADASASNSADASASNSADASASNSADASAEDERHSLPRVWSGAALGDTVPVVSRRKRSSDDWARSYRRAVIAVDVVASGLAGVAGVVLRFGRVQTEQQFGEPAVNYLALVLAFPLAWVVVAALVRAYEARYLGLGPDEFKRVVKGAISLTAVICFGVFVAKAPVSRLVVGAALPLALVLALVGRFTARRVLHRARSIGRASHRVLVVGNLNDVVGLITAVRREPQAGFVPVGVCLTRRSGLLDVPGPPIPVLGGLGDVLSAVESRDVDIVAVCGSRGVSAEGLRRLAWELEGTGVGLVVAPALTNVAGPRVHVRPVAGLPLLHVEEPVFRGAAQMLKTTVDRVGSLLALLVLSPLFGVIAAMIRLGSPGPVFFRQERIGRFGEPFRVWKFRTMVADAEERKAELAEENETDGLLFKIANDNRITATGKWLRRLSLDELPQLLNVLVGEMSLVGPRPLPTKAEDYEGDVRRRLLVRPGITGLWQVSGRSDLPWEDAVRLDLYYVDNWSLVFDFEILMRTVRAVVRSAGAY